MLCLNKFIKTDVQMINRFAIGLCVSVTRALSRVSVHKKCVSTYPSREQASTMLVGLAERPAILYVWGFI